MNNSEIVNKASELLKENLEWDERYAIMQKKLIWTNMLEIEKSFGYRVRSTYIAVFHE